MARERRLVFGEVAELYDEHRPSYPAQLVDDLIALAGLDGGTPALEVGAGTGKATAMFAARGIPVLAIEPSPQMAAVATRRLARTRLVEIETADFEAWPDAGRRFKLVFAAQSWHWVDPGVGFAKARSVLAEGGWLAAFWNRPDWPSADLREPLADAYRRAGVPPDDDPMHPAAPATDADESRWQDACAHDLRAAGTRLYRWNVEYEARAYAAMLSTHSRIRTLLPDRRSVLLAAVAQAIEAYGNRMTLPLVTRLYLAERPGSW